MRKQITRFLSGLLTVVMLLTSINVPVFADACDHDGYGERQVMISGNDTEHNVECVSCNEVKRLEPHEFNNFVAKGDENGHIMKCNCGYEKVFKHDFSKNDGICANAFCGYKHEDHNWEEHAKGAKCKICDKICNHLESESGHRIEAYGLITYISDNCTNDGSQKQRCADCKIDLSETKYIRAKSHVWNKDLTKSTCANSGCKVTCTHEGKWDATSKCSVCGVVCSHTNKWNAATGKCSVCGKECGHSSKPFTITDTTHKQVCTTCGKVYVAEASHSFDETSHLCVVCGKEDPSLCKHPEDKRKAEPNPDKTTHKLFCTVCTKTISANEVHDFGTDGNAKKCSKCEFDNPNYKCDHKTTSRTYVDNKDKTTHAVKCAECGEVVTANEKHNYKNGTCTLCKAGSYCDVHTHDYRSISDKKHEKYCIVCDTVLKTNISCSWSIEKYDDKDDWDDEGHYAYCKACGNTDFKDHSFSYDYSDNDKHDKSCGCGVKYEESCNYNDGKCSKCGHQKSGSSSSGSGAVYYAPTDIESLRKAGKALARDVITLKLNNGASYDIAAEEAPLRDMANQYFIGNILLTQLGYDLLTPTKTYKFTSYSYFAPAGQPQTIVWKNTGLKAGDVAYVVYWHPVKKTQLLPCIVGMDGSATFIVPDVNGAICTLVKCEKSVPVATTKKKK